MDEKDKQGFKLTGRQYDSIEALMVGTGVSQEIQDQVKFLLSEQFHGSTAEVVMWAQAVLTALNVGDVQGDSKLHLKLREVMVAFRARAAQNKIYEM